MNAAVLWIAIASLAIGQAPAAFPEIPSQPSGGSCSDCVEPCRGTRFGYRLRSHIARLFGDHQFGLETHFGSGDGDSPSPHRLTPQEREQIHDTLQFMFGNSAWPANSYR